MTPGQLRRVSGDVSASADELVQGLRTLDAEVSEFVGSGWTGLSSGSFAESFWRWHDGAMEVHAGLAEMAELLDSAATDYQRQDDTAAAALSPGDGF